MFNFADGTSCTIHTSCSVPSQVFDSVKEGTILVFFGPFAVSKASVLTCEKYDHLRLFALFCVRYISGLCRWNQLYQNGQGDSQVFDSVKEGTILVFFGPFVVSKASVLTCEKYDHLLSFAQVCVRYISGQHNV
jgi:hypothetical protein